jgi:hypothetical protein
MDNTKYRAINYKGKREYVWDPKGTWVRRNNEFVKEASVIIVNPEELEQKKELQILLKKNPYIKNRVKSIKNIPKKIYYIKVWLLTEANDLTILRNHEKRGFRKYHLDHIYPIHSGFKNQIPPEAIAHIDNLRFIYHTKNIKKGGEITEESINLINNIIKKII